MTTGKFTTPAEAFDAGFEFMVVRNTGRGSEGNGEVLGFYTTKAGAERAASQGAYTVLRTEFDDQPIR